MTHTSNVEWRKVLENFRSAYQSMGPADILVVELIANSFDAGADHVALSTLAGGKRLLFRIEDNGKGMQSEEEFERYHDLGSLTKIRGGTIGWAGIGAKLYLDRCDKVYTETRSATFQGASNWTFRPGDRAPHWNEVHPRGLLHSKTGTVVEIGVVDSTDKRFLVSPALTSLILSNYNYGLRPHGPAIVTVDGSPLTPFDPALTARSVHAFEFQLKSGESVLGKFFILSEAAPEGFELVSIVVHGKTVGDQYEFRQLARIKEIYRISGFVRCDPLIQIATTSKDNFNRKTPLWFDFNRKVGDRFANWLEKEGALSRLEKDTDLDELATALGKDLNRVFALPEIRDLGLDLFQLLSRRKTTLLDEAGTLKGSNTEGAQPTTGTFGGAGEGSGVLTEGDEAGTGVRVDSSGDRDVTERTRKTRGGIAIAYSDQPSRLERAWVDPGLRAIVINKAYPAFQCADGLGSIPYYTADCCFEVVTETIESSDEKDVAIRKLFQGFLEVVD